MADDLLRGESEQTPSTSPVGTKAQALETGNPIEGTQSERSPEEVELAAYTKGAQKRIKELLEDNRDLKQQVERFNAYQPPPPPSSNSTYTGAPDVQDAVRKLDQVGMATKDFVSQEVSQNLNALRYQFEIDRLEGKYTGEDDRPKFDKQEYEDFVNRHPEYRNYLPEDVYKYKMYSEELRDWEGKHSQKSSTVSTTLRPTRTVVSEQGLTPETIEQRLKEPDGKQWYEEHINEINAVLLRQAQG